MSKNTPKSQQRLRKRAMAKANLLGANRIEYFYNGQQITKQSDITKLQKYFVSNWDVDSKTWGFSNCVDGKLKNYYNRNMEWYCGSLGIGSPNSDRQYGRLYWGWQRVCERGYSLDFVSTLSLIKKYVEPYVSDVCISIFDENEELIAKYYISEKSVKIKKFKVDKPSYHRLTDNENYNSIIKYFRKSGFLVSVKKVYETENTFVIWLYGKGHCCTFALGDDKDISENLHGLYQEGVGIDTPKCFDKLGRMDVWERKIQNISDAQGLIEILTSEE